MAKYIGLDYGLGLSNIDLKTGIRYGVISCNTLSGDVMGDATPIYPDKVEIECPSCEHSYETDLTGDCDTQTCPDCGHEWEETSLMELESIGLEITPDDPDYKTDYSESLNCVFVTSAPYYTHASYCSPCAPGALDLDHPTDTDGPRAYCFGHEYFEDGIAPYTVYRVTDGSVVAPEV